MMKYIVGLTGGIGSGKTTVSNYFAKQNVTIIDADIIAREVVAIGSLGLASLVSEFGQKILLTDGTLNRSYLREMMFGDEPHHLKTKDKVNQLLHPLIAKETQSRIESADSQYVLWVVPLLFENQLHKNVNRILVVDVPPLVQIERTMKRDKVKAEHVERILTAQVSREMRLSLADDIIYGDEPLEKIEEQVIILHQKYMTNAYEMREQSTRMKST